MKSQILFLSLLSLIVGSAYAHEGHDHPPAVFIMQPADGAVLVNPVTVKFAVHGMAVQPAGTLQENTGHHHLLIDLDTLPPMDQPLPVSEHIRHFGKGQTETTLTLTPGKHTLQLLFADGAHIPHKSPLLSGKITITVR